MDTYASYNHDASIYIITRRQKRTQIKNEARQSKGFTKQRQTEQTKRAMTKRRRPANNDVNFREFANAVSETINNTAGDAETRQTMIPSSNSTDSCQNDNSCMQNYLIK